MTELKITNNSMDLAIMRGVDWWQLSQGFNFSFTIAIQGNVNAPDLIPCIIEALKRAQTQSRTNEAHPYPDC